MSSPPPASRPGLDEVRLVLLRDRLEQLARAAGIPAPPLELADPDTRTTNPARVRTRPGPARIEVAHELLDAGEAAQTWHLAAALGWWTSPEPRRRRRRVLVLGGLLLLPNPVVSLTEDALQTDVPWPVTAGGLLLVAVLLDSLRTAGRRWERRAMDEAGRRVLERAGHDPGAVTDAAFAADPEPSRWRRWRAAEPSPAERIAAARADRLRPAPPLY